MDSDRRARTIASLGGIAAVIIWSTTVAFSRNLAESLGVFSAGAFSFILAGAIGVLQLYRTRAADAGTASPPRPYLLWCGGLFVIYQLCLYAAIGLAAGGQQVVEVGIINYLWPVLTILFSIPLLKAKARPALIPGVLLALAGSVLAVCASPRGPDEGAPTTVTAYLVPALASGAALTWALYSNLARKYAPNDRSNAVPYFFLASGAVMLVLRFAFGEHSHWTTNSVLNLAGLSLFPCLIAYTLWDRAMRHGDLVFVAVFSYFTPMLSTAVTCVALGVRPGWGIWLACLLLVAGALLSRASLKEKTETE